MKHLQLYLGYLTGRVVPASAGAQRYQKLLQAGFSALASRGISIGVNVVSMPLAIGYVGNESYGVWVTITTLVAWLEAIDLGIGNGLTNFLVAAITAGQSQRAQRLVASGWWLLGVIAAGGGVLLGVAWSYIDWPSFFNVSAVRDDVRLAVVLAIGFCLLNFPLRLVGNILTALQENRLANYWRSLGSVVSLLVLLGMLRWSVGLVQLTIVLAGSAVAVNLVSAVWLFGYYQPMLQPAWAAVDRSTVRQLLSSGSSFFVLQIAALLLFQTDSLIITHTLGAAAVTPYSVAWRLFVYTNIVQTLMQPALWPAYAQAFQRGDRLWVVRTFRWNMMMALASTGFFVLILLLGGSRLIALWTGVAVPLVFLVWMGVWSLVSVAMNVMGCVLNAAGRVRNQSLYGSLAAGVNLGLSLLWAPSFGLTGVIAATVVAYLLCNVLPICREVWLVFLAPDHNS